MVFIGTKLKVADNSGAKLVKCIKVLGLGLKKTGFLGDLLLVTIKKFGKKQIKKKIIYHGLVVMIKQQVIRKDGSVVRFAQNRVILFSKDETKSKFLGTRLYGGIMKELKFQIYKNKKEKQKYFKVISYANSIL